MSVALLIACVVALWSLVGLVVGIACYVRRGDERLRDRLRSVSR